MLKQIIHSYAFLLCIPFIVAVRDDFITRLKEFCPETNINVLDISNIIYDKRIDKDESKSKLRVSMVSFYAGRLDFSPEIESSLNGLNVIIKSFSNLDINRLQTFIFREVCIQSSLVNQDGFAQLLGVTLVPKKKVVPGESQYNFAMVMTKYDADMRDLLRHVKSVWVNSLQFI